MLSTTSQYALRALAHLARCGEGQAMLGKELAKAAAIPANYLAKILLTLKNAGLLGTARGSGGGYWLARPAGQIRLVDVVQLFDSIADPVPCLLGTNRNCSPERPCSAHSKWHRVRDAYFDYLKTTTLAELVGQTTTRPAQRKNLKTQFDSEPHAAAHSPR